MLHVTKAAMTGLIDKLEALGLTRATDHKTDRRVKLVSLDTKGQKLRKITVTMNTIKTTGDHDMIAEDRPESAGY